MTENRYLPIPQQKVALHGTRVAMYIVGQEETAGESSVSVVAGVRTVTTNMDGRDVLPRLSRPFAFSTTLLIFNYTDFVRGKPGLEAPNFK